MTTSAEGVYGTDCGPDKAPEAISKAVASLPPEQMFELMKQMKHCIQNNPNEARNMLLQNPQLAYALLQTQVVMKIVDPQIALTMLHRPNAAIKPVMPAPSTDAQLTSSQLSVSNLNKLTLPLPISFPDPSFKGLPVVNPPPMGGLRAPFPSRPLGNEELIRGPPNGGGVLPFVDPRAQQFEPRDPRNVNFDVRGGPPRGPMMHLMLQPPLREPIRDPREMNRSDPRALPHDMDIRPLQFDPRIRGMDPRNIRGPPEFDLRGMGLPLPLRPRFTERGAFDQRSPIGDQRDPRNQSVRPQRPPQSVPPLPNPQSGGQDQEKAALIMQVLQLSDQQIALLPPEQRQSIMVLKEQIARSAENQK